MLHVLVHYHELALKGGNRKHFEYRLVHHLRGALKPLAHVHVEALQGRIRVSFEDETAWPRLQEQIKRVFGIVNFSLTRAVPLAYDQSDLTVLKDAIVAHLPTHPYATFRVSVKRADKRFVKTSMDVEREIGAAVADHTGKRVNLSHPDMTILVELVPPYAYYSCQRDAGPGGLPTGTGGKVICLISGGIDSPVAAYRMMKRGCKAVFVHFHGRPYLSRVSEEKVRDQVALLTKYQLSSRLHLIPFGDIQSQIVISTPPPVRVVLYRRLMLRIAARIAEQEEAWALTTGDSLGQVASQTPENISVINESTSLPILRPLIGMDKLEITQQAQALGSFETSIEPDQDCCTLFVPKHPQTRCQLSHILKVEQALDIPKLVQQSLEGKELVTFSHAERMDRRAPL
ncbi:tRNA uracil 4-sulfurtransferase ThiI [Nitrospira sp. T9]|uniref:tRNA uracil 4-sulfurtransferase ThiI n=1 Tax=unclassified Nitrospira TaxID=2652172 RepID=UPI003F9808F6